MAVRNLVAAALVSVAALGACTRTSDATSATTVPEPEDTTTSSTTTAAPTTTLNVEDQIVVDLGVRYPEIVEGPSFGTLIALDVTVDDDGWPSEPASLYDDPPGECEGPVPLDAGPLRPVVRIPYGSEIYSSVEIFAMPVNPATASGVAAAWDAYADLCTDDVSTGAFQSYHRIGNVAGRPVVAARLVTDRTQIPTYRADMPDIPVMDTARWFGIEGDLLYLVSAVGPEPADALEAASALVAALTTTTGS